MQTVVELPRYIKTAKDAGMSEVEMTEVVTYIAQHPDAGDEIKGTGGCRKLRFAGKGKGKSGGYRVVTFYSGVDIPVFLLAAYAKNDRANLTAAEAKALGSLTKVLVDSYKKRVTPLRSA
ncbi:MAG: type II toxin-antitoxin system RelE/ParE family toxin [Rhizomicrobium sp.]